MKCRFELRRAESDGKIHSGCTAVAAFLRIEDADGKQSSFASLPAIEALDLHADDEDVDSAHTSGSESPKDLRDQNQRHIMAEARSKALMNLSSTSHSVNVTPRSASPGALERAIPSEWIHRRHASVDFTRVLYMPMPVMHGCACRAERL